MIAFRKQYQEHIIAFEQLREGTLVSEKKPLYF